jgi:hypothetical protein
MLTFFFVFFETFLLKVFYDLTVDHCQKVTKRIQQIYGGLDEEQKYPLENLIVEVIDGVSLHHNNSKHHGNTISQNLKL